MKQLNLTLLALLLSFVSSAQIGAITGTPAL